MLQKQQELTSLQQFRHSQPTLKLKSFQIAKIGLEVRELELLELWESILTGRSAPLSRWMKERYQRLGLSHLFTPSGFHLSAVLMPFLKIITARTHQFYFLTLLCLLSLLLPGMAALKRMLMIKTQQRLLGQHWGFILALLFDVLFGGFQRGTLSFTYSFLFLGIIYSGVRGSGLVLYFFLGQILIALFQGNDVSPLFIFFSPLLNLAFGLAMPLLFFLAIPLWKWQLFLGLKILACLQFLVDGVAFIVQLAPTLEVQFSTLLIFWFLLKGRWKYTVALTLIFSGRLNLDLQRSPNFGSHEFVPKGAIMQVIHKKDYLKVVRSDGNCRVKLVRGFWWKNCSPRRRSSRKRKI